MDETILAPSPNWFQVSGLAVSKDGWIVYGGPSKSLCILQPLLADHNGVLQGTKYHAHVFNRVNYEKITTVDISPEWPVKRTILTGSADGSVKLWNVDKLLQSNKVKAALSHEVHSRDKEEVVGVGYSNEVYAITVGCYGNIVKWDLTSNIVNIHTHIKQFKPLCMACSPHKPLNVAIGTKQGVVFVLDLNGHGKVLYKVRGQDDEIINISWCPQYEVILKKALKESEKRANKAIQDKEHKEPTEDPVEKPTEPPASEVKEALEASGFGKDLPDDSFDATSEEIVQEDDMFDIYKDHEADEFGHKKFEPEEICVKVKEDKKEEDFLAECLKLKEDILKKKQGEGTSIQVLVDALDNTHVDNQENEDQGESSFSSKLQDDGKTNVYDKKDRVEASSHFHKHLLASIGKYGGVRIWSKTGKLVSSCVVNHATNKNQRGKLTNWPTILWYKPDTILIADGKSQLVEVNPLKIDCKNKLDWNVVHALHKRGLFCIASNAPRMQTGEESGDDWTVYTVSQDRSIIQYSLRDRQKLSVINTCGGFIYTIQPCPYDAGKMALSVGDGAVRIWETSLEEGDTKLSPGQVTSYWQNVQGKVLTVAWHPSRENWLAFATAESRIGLIDISSKNEKPAKVLLPALNGGIYSICWGEENNLYACANGDLVMYQATKYEDAPTHVPVEMDDRKWEVSSVKWYPQGLVCGSLGGAVGVLAPQFPHVVQAAMLVFSKMVHTVEWHPQQTSSSNDESPFKNLLAACSCEKHSNIVILEYLDKEDGGKQLQTYKTLSGHKWPVLQLQWNPHVDGQLLSTSQDHTVRIWEASSGSCLAIFPGHAAGSLGASWAAHPAFTTKLVSGGGDCAARLWDLKDYPPEAFDESRLPNRKEKKTKKKDEPQNQEADQKPEVPQTDQVAVKSREVKGPKKFLLPIMNRPNSRDCLLHAARIMFKKYLEKTSEDKDLADKMSQEINSKGKVFSEKAQKIVEKPAEHDGDEQSTEELNPYDFEYLKIFGSINEVNEILDKQLEHHEKLQNYESWITLSVFRGHIDAMIQFAAARDLLCPYLLSIAPCVSYKYWKDATQLYLAQIDRQMAKGGEKKLDEAPESRSYGGWVYRKVATLLSLHDAVAAVSALRHAKLYKEAYVLCRTRYMDSIAEETLNEWAQDRVRSGLFVDAALFYIILGNLTEAATLLSKLVLDRECLDLAADIARVAGQNMLLEHIAEKRENIKNITEKHETEMSQLPTRVELLTRAETEEIQLPKVEVVPVEADEENEQLGSGVEVLSKEIEQSSAKVELLTKEETERILAQLPSKIELLMKEKQNTASNSNDAAIANGNARTEGPHNGESQSNAAIANGNSESTKE